MARRETREDAIARADRNSTEAFCSQQALQASLVGDLEHLVTVHYDGWRVMAYTTGLARVNGGVVVIRSDTNGQPPYVTATYAETWMQRHRARHATRLDEETAALNRIADKLQCAMYAAQTAAA